MKDSLTPRELEVLAGISAGSSLKHIGASLGISFKTVSTHRHRILQKLGLKTKGFI